MTTPVAPQDDGRKVFVGNLAFDVDDETLASYFSAAGPVENAHVIRRGPRSLGYGFVTFHSEEHAIAAQKSLNKSSFNDREINVELAKARQEGEMRPRRGGFRGRGRRFGYNYYGGGYSGRGGFRGGRRFRSTRPPRTEGTPSTTTLFVANIPYTMNDEGLSNLFGKFKVVNAHIVTLRSGRSKGYGFVEFENASEQQKALVEMNNAVVEQRPLTVKVALNTPSSEETLTA